jgi:hypothetical protein
LKARVKLLTCLECEAGEIDFLLNEISKDLNEAEAEDV